MIESRKSILLGVHLGFATRYLLQTDILARLLELGHSVVILTPNAGDERFRADYEQPGVVIEQFDYDAIDAIKGTALSRYFVLSRQFTLPAHLDHETLKDKLRVFRATNRKKRWTSRLVSFLSLTTAALLRRSRRLRNVFVAAEARLLGSDFHRDVFEKHDPAAVVLIDLGTLDRSNYLMREARRRGVPIISAILSWDNLTAKGIGAVKPDYAVAWNENMRRELIEYHDLPANKVSVAGVAHFDKYHRPGFPMPGTEVRRELGVPADQRLIVFGSSSPSLFRENLRIIELLCDAIDDGRLDGPTHLVVRLHPAYVMRASDANKAELEKIHDFCTLRGGTATVNMPEVAARLVGWEMPIRDVHYLGSLLAEADVLVTQFSTLMLEAAMVDCPIVNVGFDDFRASGVRSGFEVAKRTHLKRILDTGFTRIAHSEDELVELVNRYLRSPQHEVVERRGVAEAEGGPNKGGAGAAAADFIARVVEEHVRA